MTELNASIRNISIPQRMRRLPISDKGFPIPWFVYIDIGGTADFRVIGPGKIEIALMKRLCWLCGQPLGTWYCFTVGPMCVVNRVTAEPPEHLDCAEYGVRACPFLSNPRMRRNSKDMHPNHRNIGGEMIERNPGVTALYITRSYKPLKVHNGMVITIGPAERVIWYAEGRKAERDEIVQSIATGLPALQSMAIEQGPDAIKQLQRSLNDAQRWLPAGSAVY